MLHAITSCMQCCGKQTVLLRRLLMVAVVLLPLLLVLARWWRVCAMQRWCRRAWRPGSETGTPPTCAPTPGAVGLEEQEDGQSTQTEHTCQHSCTVSVRPALNLVMLLDVYACSVLQGTARCHPAGTSPHQCPDGTAAAAVQ
jgi:hypothetical protein